jgi:hypothetical protein
MLHLNYGFALSGSRFANYGFALSGSRFANYGFALSGSRFGPLSCTSVFFLRTWSLDSDTVHVNKTAAKPAGKSQDHNRENR